MRSFDDEVTLTIDGMDSKSRGIARMDGYVVFVPGALVGETILAKFVERRKHYGVATIKSILKSSDYRVPPKCEYYEACGGCDLQHASYDYQLSAKEHLIGEAITRIGKWPNVIIEPIVPSPQVWGYRNKAIIHTRYQKNQKKLGYFARGTHEVIDIKRCPVLDPLLNDLYNLMRDVIEHSDVTFYDERSSNGLLRHVVMRSSLSSRKTLMAWILSRKPKRSEMDELKRISTQLINRQSSNLQGIIVNINISKGNFVWGPETFLLAGDEINLRERLGAFELSYNVSDFFQVNVPQAYNICKTVSKHIADNSRVLELYAGVGTITCFLASICENVVAVEEWQPACKSLSLNIAKNGLSNVLVACGKAEDVVFNKIDGDFDAIVLDPPRTGCHKDVLTFIGKIRPTKIVYVSCNPVTLARDGKVLMDMGYKPVNLLPLDMFPQTSHVECVTLMTRTSQTTGGNHKLDEKDISASKL